MLLKHDPITSWEMYRWPEFQALIKRLGMPEGLRLAGIKIIAGPDRRGQSKTKTRLRSLVRSKSLFTTN